MKLENDLVRALAKTYKTPFFIYDLDEVERRVKILEDAFLGIFQISFAMKCNPHKVFLDLFNSHLPSLDISSGGELQRALACGWQGAAISFTGPAKQKWELQYAVKSGVGKIVIESLREAELLQEILSSQGTTQSILIRISPNRLPRGFGVNMSGKPNQFGIDEEDMPTALEKITSLDRLKLKGFHIYSGTQCLNIDAIVENFENFVTLFRRFSHEAGIEPQALIFGSGFGIPYHEGMEPLDIQTIAKRTTPILQELMNEDGFSNCKFYIELGRWLIGEAGTYVTSVVSRKDSRGTAIGICDGGMNHHLGACGHLGSVIHRNYQMRRIPVDDEIEEESLEMKEYNMVGPLCTSIDTLGHSVKFNDLKVGDYIAISCSGAYGLTSSPVNFISHPLPNEITIRSRDEELISQLLEPDLLANFDHIMGRNIS